MKPTIKKIAQLAGLTHATVSMVLNDKPGPSLDTKEKVLKIAKELGYVPNINARNLVKGTSNTLGVFLLNFPQEKKDRIFYYYMEFFQDLIIEARKKGYNILFYTDQDNTRSKISYAEFCIEQNLKSAIFLGMNKEDENLESLKKLKNTQIILFDIEETKNCNTIISDSYQGIEEMFYFLLKKNVKNLAIISGVDNAEIATQKKIKELNYFSKKSKINIQYFQGDFLYESAYKIGKAINMENYEAIFAMNDAMGIGFSDALKERGLVINKDYILIGFDNLSISEIINPKMHSIAHDNLKITESIFNIIKQKDKFQQIFVPTRFIKK